jgi:hypothetical protein
MKRLKILTGSTAIARFLAECAEGFIGEIPRQPQIPSPYRFSPTHCVYSWNSRPVIVVETSHRRFGVFAVPVDMISTEGQS